jgi:aryl-alcohol dehydrogenase-like predicted oxidoreductase
VNLLDTAEVYGTEEIVGKAIREVSRDQLVVSTKKTLPSPNQEDPGGELRKGLEQSLRRLGTEYVDLYHLHGVEPDHYPFAVNRLVPALVKLREQGKIRGVGITEAFGADPQHRMLQQALCDNCFDVVMVGFNLLNQSARVRVLEKTKQENVGVLIMFAVRKALSRPVQLREAIQKLKEQGLVDLAGYDSQEPLEFLLTEAGASSYPDAAYRYCRHEPGVHVVLTGTGNLLHLGSNVESLLKPPLPAPVLLKLREIFAKVDCVSGR